jgi:hypothetical protein
MATITTRVQGDSPKGSPLTNAEVDNNFINLNTAKYESGDNATFGSLTSTSTQKFSPATLYGANHGNARLLLQTINGSVQMKFSRTNNVDTTYETELGSDSNGFNIWPGNYTGGAKNTFGFAGGTTVFNEDSSDIDFRVESDSNSHMLFVDAANNSIGVNLASPNSNSLIDVNGGDGLKNQIRISSINAQIQNTFRGVYGNLRFVSSTASTSNTGNAAIFLARKNYATVAGSGNDKTDQVGLHIKGYYDNSGTSSPIYLGGFGYSDEKSRVQIYHTSVVVNDDSVDADFRVESDANSNMLFVNAGANTVSIGTDVSSGMLHVGGSMSQSALHNSAQYTGSLSQSAGGQTWVKVAEFDNPCYAEIVYYVGTNNAEERGKITFKGTYYGDNRSPLTWDRGTYNRMLDRVRISQSAGGANHILWFLFDTDSNSHTGATSYGFQIINCMSNSLPTIHNTTGSNPPTNGLKNELQAEYTENNSLPSIKYSAPLEIDARIRNATSADYNFILSQNDYNNAINQDGGSGVGMLFKPATNSTAEIGAAIEAVCYSASDDNTATRLLFKTTGDDANFHEGLRLDYDGSVIVNEQSEAGVDFRVESDTNTHALFVDASSDRVGVRVSEPQETLHLNGGMRQDNVSYSNFFNKYVDPRDVSNGTYYGYLLLTPTHPAPGSTSTSTNVKSCFGTIMSSRGSSGTGNSWAVCDFAVSTAYTNDYGHIRMLTGTGTYTMYLSKVTFDGVGYWALKYSFTGGSAHNGIYFTGSAKGYDSNFLQMKRHTEVAVETENYAATAISTGANGDVTINEESFARDFRVESNNDSHMLYVDAGNDRVIIGDSGTPQGGKLNIFHNQSSSGGGALYVQGSSDKEHYLYSGFDGSGTYFELVNTADSGSVAQIRWQTRKDGGGSYLQNIQSAESSAGNVFNEASGNFDFRVESDANAHALFVDASAGRIGMFNSTPQAGVHISNNALIGTSSGAPRSQKGLTVGLDVDDTFAWNTDIGDANRFLSIVNDSTTTNAYSALSFRVNPNGGYTGNAMMDMKFVQSGSNTSAMHWTFNSGGSGAFRDLFSVYSTGNLRINGALTTHRYEASTSEMHRFLLPMYMMGNQTYTIRLRGLGSGIAFVRLFGSHWSSPYHLIKEGYVMADSYASLSQEWTKDQASSQQGGWSVSRPTSGQTGYQTDLIITKSAGSYAGSFNGMIEILGQYNLRLISIT